MTLPLLTSAWKFDYRFGWMQGDIYAKHDNSYVYALPCMTGESYIVSQSCHGSFSHFGEAEYAIDFAMPEGTAVTAARGGVVVGIKENDSKAGGMLREKREGNYILIEHDDGTFTLYRHLKSNGSTVILSERVKRGDINAFSGNSGYSTGAHLHFAVFAFDSSKKRFSLPIRLESREETLSCPKEKSRLTAK